MRRHGAHQGWVTILRPAAVRYKFVDEDTGLSINACYAELGSSDWMTCDAVCENVIGVGKFELMLGLAAKAHIRIGLKWKRRNYVAQIITYRIARS
jgi:hypothetical protein